MSIAGVLRHGWAVVLSLLKIPLSVTRSLALHLYYYHLLNQISIAYMSSQLYCECYGKPTRSFSYSIRTRV